ncbi:MAG: PEGA domain-containing protein [Spirochaetota bacterium]
MMRKILLLLLTVSAMVLSAYPGVCGPSGAEEINPFLERKIIIGRFRNAGEKSYDYLESTIRTALYDYALSVQFVTITEQERSLLQRISTRPAYTEAFQKAGGSISYKMQPVVTEAPCTEKDFGLEIQGSYLLQNQDIKVDISVFNHLTDNVYLEYSTTLPLQAILDKPQEFAVSFYTQFLKYKTFLVSITARPPDSLILVDGNPAGVGTSGPLLLTPGLHNIRVTKEGFHEYADIIRVDRDNFSMQAALEPLPKNHLFISSKSPREVDVYIDEQYAGKTPFTLSYHENTQNLSFVKENYHPLTLAIQQLEAEKNAVKVQLIETWKIQRMYEEAEMHKKRSRILSYSGLGMLGLAVLLGTQKTLYTQKAELYKGNNPQKYNQALNAEKTFTALTLCSAVISGGLFSFSFVELLQYFHTYNKPNMQFYQRSLHEIKRGPGEQAQ